MPSRAKVQTKRSAGHSLSAFQLLSLMHFALNCETTLLDDRLTVVGDSVETVEQNLDRDFRSIVAHTSLTVLSLSDIMEVRSVKLKLVVFC